LVPVYEDQDASSAELTVDPATGQNMGLRLAPVKTGTLTRTISAAGYLMVAQPLQYDINLRVSGWIQKLSADTLGMHITKGQTLFDLYSPQLTVAVGELIAARQARPSARDASSMHATASDVLYQAARQKLLLWGLPPDQVDRLAAMKSPPATISFTSPAEGVLMEKDVVEGSAVNSGQRVMRIVDQRTLWLDAQLHAQDMPWIRLGQEAEAHLEAWPGQSWHGTVIFIDPKVNPLTRTTTVRLSIDNSKLNLRPGMFASVGLLAKQETQSILVPRAAVIDTGLRRLAFIAQGGGHFEPRDVKPGLAGDDGMVQVLHGLSAGEQVVVSGQFLLDADSRMREAVRKFLSENESPQHKGTK
jgi:Cu(I)/Ag(I) efflux system membrane fusion protein/cobalt-zinc-cadmium efflux system membrane fusion protein